MTRLTFGTLLILLSTIAFGQSDQVNKHPIDTKLESCLSVDSNFTTQGMIRCEVIARKEWERELEKNYVLLMETLDSVEREKLQASQRQWLEYRDKEIAFVNSSYHAKEGTMWLVVAAARKTEILKNRALELKAYYETLNEKE